MSSTVHKLHTTPITPAGAELSLDELVAHNERRLEAYVSHPFFRLVDGTTTPEKRRALLACIQRFSRSFQTVMFTRQAMCADPRYYETFLQHFNEELGHDQLVAQREHSEEASDPVLEATLTWFSYQMLVLDNVEKAALVHLVLESSGDKFHNAAAPHLGQHVRSSYFQTHAELDSGHADVGLALLEKQHPAVYARIKIIVDAGWDMLDAASTRMCELVEQA
jgi:hypothetical protein